MTQPKLFDYRDRTLTILSSSQSEYVVEVVTNPGFHKDRPRTRDVLLTPCLKVLRVIETDNPQDLPGRPRQLCMTWLEGTVTQEEPMQQILDEVQCVLSLSPIPREL